MEKLENNRRYFWEFLNNSIDNDKLIIVGVLILAAIWVITQKEIGIADTVVGGLIGYIARKEKK